MVHRTGPPDGIFSCDSRLHHQFEYGKYNSVVAIFRSDKMKGQLCDKRRDNTNISAGCIEVRTLGQNATKYISWLTEISEGL